MSRICITCGAGFIWLHLCDELLAAGHEVIAMDNLVSGKMKNLEAAYYNDRFSTMSTTSPSSSTFRVIWTG